MDLADNGVGELTFGELRTHVEWYRSFLRWVHADGNFDGFDDADQDRALDVRELRRAVDEFVRARGSKLGGSSGASGAKGATERRGDSRNLSARRRAATLGARSTRGRAGDAVKGRVREIVKKLMRELDDNDDGKLSIRELTRNLRGSKEYRGFLDFVSNSGTWSRFDRDGGGSLDISELRNAVTEWVESAGEDGYDAQHSGSSSRDGRRTASATSRAGEGRRAKRGGDNLGVRGRAARTHRGGGRDER